MADHTMFSHTVSTDGELRSAVIPVTPPKPSPQRDWIVRVKPNEWTVISTTERFIDQITTFHTESSIKNIIINNLWRDHRYNEHYSAYLLGQYEEEEFAKIAEECAATYITMTREQIIMAVSIIQQMFGQVISSHDASIMLNVDPKAIEDSIADNKLLA